MQRGSKEGAQRGLGGKIREKCVKTEKIDFFFLSVQNVSQYCFLVFWDYFMVISYDFGLIFTGLVSIAHVLASKEHCNSVFLKQRGEKRELKGVL